MRPINKGDHPLDQNSGNPIDIIEYGHARPELLNRIGDYCSYCENQITNPAIEHIQPKAVVPGVQTNWYNFLLACGSCNSRKGDEYLDVDQYYWPDIHNTALLFEMQQGGVVSIKTILHPSIELQKAQNTLELVGLDAYGSNTTHGDRRWKKRLEAWNKANDALNYYIKTDYDPDYIQSITNNATSTGFWSVWMKVFEKRIEVQEQLINSFAGTYEGCLVKNIDRLP
jgi:hypothetical protein